MSSLSAKRSWGAALLLSLLLQLTAGCAESSSTLCTYDTDCPQGYQCADGQCSGLSQPDLGPATDGRSAELGPADGSAFDGEAPPADQLLTADVDPSSCQPNGDDRVERAEMPLKLGITVPFSSGSGISVDLAGAEEQGQLVWDLTADAPDEGPLPLEVLEPFSWASPKFPEATYVTPLDLETGSWGVFQLGQDALTLQGYVSQQPSDIDLTYSEPVQMLRFPLEVGLQAASSAFLTGFMNGIYLYLFETYELEVLAAGRLKLPQLALDAVLVRLISTQAPASAPLLMTTKATFIFVSECYGIVAQVFVEGDPGGELQQVVAAERRRLSF